MHASCLIHKQTIVLCDTIQNSSHKLQRHDRTWLLTQVAGVNREPFQEMKYLNMFYKESMYHTSKYANAYLCITLAQNTYW